MVKLSQTELQKMIIEILVFGIAFLGVLLSLVLIGLGSILKQQNKDAES